MGVICRTLAIILLRWTLRQFLEFLLFTFIISIGFFSTFTSIGQLSQSSLLNFRHKQLIMRSSEFFFFFSLCLKLSHVSSELNFHKRWATTHPFHVQCQAFSMSLNENYLLQRIYRKRQKRVSCSIFITFRMIPSNFLQLSYSSEYCFSESGFERHFFLHHVIQII